MEGVTLDRIDDQVRTGISFRKYCRSQGLFSHSNFIAVKHSLLIQPSEVTPLAACFLASLIKKAGFPPGTVNFVNGYGKYLVSTSLPSISYCRGSGNKAGQRIAEHPDIWKVAFTGSTLTGRMIQEASAKSNLKVVTLELGGKSPNIIFDDADIEQAVKWAAFGLLYALSSSLVASQNVLKV